MNTLEVCSPIFGLICAILDTAELQTDDWSDEEEGAHSTQSPQDMQQATRRIRQLEEALKKANQDLADYRAFVSKRLNLASLSEALKEPAASSSTHLAVPLRDDDSHYFQSYGENGEFLCKLLHRRMDTYWIFLIRQTFTLS